MDQQYIQINNLHKRFHTQTVLDGVDIDIGKGESIVIIGQSGCGKSVLLKHLNCLLEPDEGEILFDGNDIAELQGRDLVAFRQRMGMLFQSSALFDSMTVAENVGLGLKESRRFKEAEIEDIVMEKLEMVGLAESASKKPSELSGGMRKRVKTIGALGRDAKTGRTGKGNCQQSGSPSL